MYILTPFACGVLQCGAHFGACIPGIAFFPRHRLYTLKSLQVGKTRHLSAEQRIYTQTISFTKMCVKIVRFLRGCLESAAGRRKRLYHHLQKENSLEDFFPPPRYFSPLCPNLKPRPEIPMQHFLPPPCHLLVFKIAENFFSGFYCTQTFLCYDGQPFFHWFSSLKF